VTVPQAPDAGVQEADEQRDEARLRLRRGRLVTAVVAGVLVLAVAAVALLGGFRQRTDLLTRVPAGTVITTGPYEVTLARATVQHRTDDDEWEVVASGTIRTTGTASIDPPSGDSGFLFARSAAGGEVRSSRSVTLGAPAGLDSQDTLTPGLPPVPWSVTFRYDVDPGAELLLAVYDQEYTTAYLFGDEKTWVNTNQASTTILPLEPLPDTKY
jgi:hypothetical protein